MTIDFRTLAAPRTPNSWLSAPEWAEVGHANERMPLVALSPAALLERLLAVARAEPRTEVTTVAQGRAELVQRSALFRFVDRITIDVLPSPDGAGAGAIIWSRSLVGRSDLGVNRRRVRRWLAKAGQPGPAAR